MRTNTEKLQIQVQAIHAATSAPFAGVSVEVVLLAADGADVVAHTISDSNGIATLELDPDLWGPGLEVRVVGQAGHGVALFRAELDGSIAVLPVTPSDEIAGSSLTLLADHLVATRRVLADDLANDLATPSSDSVVRLLPVADRARLLDDLKRGLERVGKRAQPAVTHLVDPVALRDGSVKLVPIFELPSQLEPASPAATEADSATKPGLGWDRFPWSLPDDQSYRDYLRSVFVLFAHQQKLGLRADPRTFRSVVERQLGRRFFQDFRTTKRDDVPLNRLLIPIVTSILTARAGSHFGFGVVPTSLPAQGTRTDRQHLEALLALAPVGRREFANRYRLPLTEPDSVMSSPVALNVYTLSRVLSDTAQGPLEPPENTIEPQLPGEEQKPILWKEVVGSAPFFLRYDEWLARQQPFYAENLFAPRTQVESVAKGPWLTDVRRKFLEHHQTIPATQNPNQDLRPYNGLFGSIGEVHRSARFLLSYGAADAKLAEVVQAIDKGQFPAAKRLADEAQVLLNKATPEQLPGEDWANEPIMDGVERPRSLARRRKLKVSSITELTGTSDDSPRGFERFFELGRPEDLWQDVYHFRVARDLATQLRIYQIQFLLPLLRAMVQAALGDLPAAVDTLSDITGFYIGIGNLGTPAGMVEHPGTPFAHKRAVADRQHSTKIVGDRPYTARVMYSEARELEGPFSLTPQVRNGDVLKPDPPLLHPLEERYARIVMADALLAWSEVLYRTDDASNLERARELYKAVLLLHGSDPGTSAYLPARPVPGWSGLVENPRIRNQLDRARLALHQLELGLNFYGYGDDAVPTLRYGTLANASLRWAVSAKSAQTDYLAYLGRVEQLDLDLLAANAHERKARTAVAITTEQVEIARAGVVVAKKLVADVEKLIAEKQEEIDDADSLFGQFKDYFSGMKSSISSMVDVGKATSEGYTSLSASGVGDALGLGGKGAGSVSLGGAMSGLAVVGGFGAFAVVSTTTLLGMAEAGNKRREELTTLVTEVLPAAHAAVRVQERNAAIADLQGQIAITELAYARELITYHDERFLNRDFWDALAGVARRSLHRLLDLAGQAAWFAERALAYQLATPIRVVRIGYFDARMRDIGGVDRLTVDLAELEALRLGAARVTVPITRTYSLARDLPLAYGQLKATGRCTFALSDDDLTVAHPGTFAHRIRAVDVEVDAPGTVAPTRGMLTNGGFSLLRRELRGTRAPLLRFADAYPISEFRVRSDLALHGLPGEGLLPFEGAGFTTNWTLELPEAANPAGLPRITDVRITFDVQAAYAPPPLGAGAAPEPASRALFVSALALDAVGLSTLHDSTKPLAQVRFDLDRLALPAGAVITNVAVLLPGVVGGNFDATLRFGNSAAKSFQIDDGLAMSNTGVLSDGNPANARPLNALVGGAPARPATLTITKNGDGPRLTRARDALLWLEYAVA